MYSHATSFAFVIVLLIGSFVVCDGKIYDRCELARELRDVHEIPDNQLGTWVCIARHESEYNTSAINHGSGDHGLFQISQLFWCSPPGYACGLSCEDVRNEDIEDDIICARRIYREHKRLSGDGFNAWVVYGLYCRDKQYASTFLDGCFAGGLKTATDRIETPTKPLPTINYYPQFNRKTTSATTPKSTTTTTQRSTTTTVSITETATPRYTTIYTTTRQPQRKSPATTFEPSTTTMRSTTTISNKKTITKKIDIGIGTGSGGAKKPLKPTEENDEFTYAISKTGYKFTRF